MHNEYVPIVSVICYLSGILTSLCRLKMGSKILEQKVTVDVGLLQQVHKMHGESMYKKKSSGVCESLLGSHLLIQHILCREDRLFGGELGSNSAKNLSGVRSSMTYPVFSAMIKLGNALILTFLFLLICSIMNQLHLGGHMFCFFL